MYYPLLFAPVYKEMVWGGRRLRDRLHREPPFEKTGESWDMTCRPQEMSVVENGPLAGQTLAQLIAQDAEGWLGTRPARQERFPLLIKIIDAHDHLSVQVHPGDAYAQAHANGEYGKNEMWYIMEAPEDGHLIIGLKDGVTQADLAQAYEAGTVEDCLYRLPVKPGDLVNIPAGLIHALTRGVMVAEIQQNSDVTYRLYDYNRLGLDGKPRPLHQADALAVTDFEGRIPKRVIPGLTLREGENRFTYAVANRYFAIIKYDLRTPWSETANPEAFAVFTCVAGEGRVSTPEASVTVPMGRSVMIPAGLGAYTLTGTATWLKSFVPDIEKDFLNPLRAHGYTDADIYRQTAVG